MENSKEARKIAESELEKISGGLVDSQAWNWFNRNRDEIFARADKAHVSVMVIILTYRHLVKDRKMHSVDDLKRAINCHVNVNDLN